MSEAPFAVPHSGGTGRPKLKAPANAADCHMHIYDSRFPQIPSRAPVANAAVADYRLLQKRNGTTRAVIVQPAAYGTDNRVTLDAVAQLGIAATRGVAVVHPGITDTELVAMDKGGIRGLRFSLHEPRTAVTSIDMIEPLAHRVHRLGWHVQLHLRAEQIVELAALIEALPCTVVFDHMARLPQPEGTRHAALRVVRRLIDKGNAWVKLSGPYLDTKIGPPRYADIKPIARALVEHAPERCVWGSDWPHPTEPHSKPDDAEIFDLFQEWIVEEVTRLRVLVSNPAKLYGF